MQRLIVALVDEEGRILHQQPYRDFITGPKSLAIVNSYTGDKLFDILYDEVGAVKFENNKFAFKFVLENNLYNVAMKLLGKVAEAVLVRRCREDEDVNKNWLSLARRRNTKYKTAERCLAVGTGLLSYKTQFQFRYNPSDPQCDVKWVEKETGKFAQMLGSDSTFGLDAGLQIKVSKNGAAYFLDDLVNLRYEVPVVYFDVANDFDSVASKLYKKLPFDTIKIGEDFICAKAIDYDGYLEVCNYVELIEALIDGRLTPVELLNNRDISSNTSMKSAITSTVLSEINLPNLILT